MRIEVLLQRVHPEVALAGVVEQHPQSAVHKLEGSECEFGQVFGVWVFLQFVCEIEQMSFHRHFCFVRSFLTFFLVSLYGSF